MLSRRGAILGGAALLTAGCAGSQQSSNYVSTSSYRGPQVTQVIVAKKRRRIYLMSGRQVLRQYPIGLGFAPEGDKKVLGDGKTPEGRYYIDRRNPESQFYLSLGISYPNARDMAEARRLGEDPGGDIFIHGESPGRMDGRDWTAGCISVSNPDMEAIYAMVQDGTVIDILP
ncbi:L,D-transpeptidase family protein [Actibacterium sp. MT2.3-13A]|uniref:L,D-transpeptidase family protein n=1 Tax=Actibacterium sp. MT2.3-13A TaxID=2828332 RepID=UPI001BA84158|nr:L,D-transpeptidase family protein [Actibacterium sp. MT2.3-13A]